MSRVCGRNKPDSIIFTEQVIILKELDLLDQTSQYRPSLTARIFSSINCCQIKSNQMMRIQSIIPSLQVVKSF